MRALIVLVFAAVLILTSCKKELINTDYLANQSWYVSNPASFVNGLPIVFGADSVFYADGNPKGTWSRNDNHVFLKAQFGGADSMEFDITELRADFLKFKITKSTLHAQLNQIVELDTIP
ncbi:MAG: hypothetical protein U0V74_02035 [Chitinophagales bacterium]